MFLSSDILNKFVLLSPLSIWNIFTHFAGIYGIREKGRKTEIPQVSINVLD